MCELCIEKHCNVRLSGRIHVRKPRHFPPGSNVTKITARDEKRSILSDSSLASQDCGVGGRAYGHMVVGGLCDPIRRDHCVLCAPPAPCSCLSSADAARSDRGRHDGTGIAASADRSKQVFGLRRLRHCLSRDGSSRCDRSHRWQSGAGQSHRMHRSRGLQSRLSFRCDHPGVRHGTARLGHSAAQAQLRIQCAGNLCGRRTRRHGIDQKCIDARPASARGDCGIQSEAFRRTRRADHRRRPGGSCGIARRKEAGHELPDAGAGSARRRGVSIPPRQAGDDRAGRTAHCGQGTFSQYDQGRIVGILDSGLQRH